MISHKCKFVFVHIPKTGGTSIAYALHGFCENVIKHQFAMDMIDELNDKSRYFKFTLVRNPWEREVSRYFYQRMKKDHENHREAMKYGFKDWLKKRHRDDIFLKNLGSPMLDWLIDDDGNLLVDFVARLENIKSDWDVICGHLDIDIELPHLNKSGHKHYREYYDGESKSMIEDVYLKDIEYFKYLF